MLAETPSHSQSLFWKKEGTVPQRRSGPSQRPTETDVCSPAVLIHSPGSRQDRDGADYSGTFSSRHRTTLAQWDVHQCIASKSHTIALALGLVTSGPNCHADKQTVKRDWRRQNKMSGFALCPSLSLSSQLFAQLSWQYVRLLCRGRRRYLQGLRN